MHVEFSSDADEIQLEGPPEEVEQAKTALERFTKELVSRAVDAQEYIGTLMCCCLRLTQ